MSSLLIRNIKTLLQAETDPRPFAKGAEMSELPLLHQAYLLLEDDRIVAFGPMRDCPERADEVIDATDRLVFPSWCDSHTPYCICRYARRRVC